MLFFSDSNVNLLEPNLKANKLMDTLTSNGFSNVIKYGTRFTLNSCSLIDQTFINNQKLTGQSGVITSLISDHLPTFINIDVKRTFEKPATVFKRFFSPDNITLFKNLLSEVSWNSILAENNVVSATQILLKFGTQFLSKLSLPSKHWRMWRIYSRRIIRRQWRYNDILKFSLIRYFCVCKRKRRPCLTTNF